MKSFTLRITTLIVSLLLLAPAVAQRLDEQFRLPSGDAKPWTLWYWMYGAVSDEGVRADLQSMADAGLGGAYLVTIRSSDDKRGVEHQGDSDQLSENWWKRVHTAFNEADRLGLQLGVHICDGFALAGGPWITPEESMQKVVSSHTSIEGGKPQTLTLEKPSHYENYYEDIALVALPQRGEAVLPVPTVRVETVAENVAENHRASIDEKGVIRARAKSRIYYTFAQPIEVRNVEIILSGNNYQAHRLRMSVKNSRGDYDFVSQLEPARHGCRIPIFNRPTPCRRPSAESSASSGTLRAASQARRIWMPPSGPPTSKSRRFVLAVRPASTSGRARPVLCGV